MLGACRGEGAEAAHSALAPAHLLPSEKLVVWFWGPVLVLGPPTGGMAQTLGH